MSRIELKGELISQQKALELVNFLVEFDSNWSANIDNGHNHAYITFDKDKKNYDMVDFVVEYINKNEYDIEYNELDSSFKFHKKPITFCCASNVVKNSYYKTVEVEYLRDK